MLYIDDHMGCSSDKPVDTQVLDVGIACTAYWTAARSPLGPPLFFAFAVLIASEDLASCCIYFETDMKAMKAPTLPSDSSTPVQSSH